MDGFQYCTNNLFLTGALPFAPGGQHVQNQLSESSSTMDSPSYHEVSSSLEPGLVGIPAAPLLHLQDPSVARGRGVEPSLNTGVNEIQPQNNIHAASPHPQPPSAAAFRPGRGIDGGLERKPSASYGHHRQTSIVHGIQHSRNASFVNSPETSPLSTHMVTSASNMSTNGYPSNPGQKEISDLPTEVFSFTNTSGAKQAYSMTSTLVNDNDAPDATHSFSTPRRLERMHSGKVRREHGHHYSHTKTHHHQQEVQTVGEYALYHLSHAVSCVLLEKNNERC